VFIGSLRIPCTCSRGEIDYPTATLDVRCKVCTHPISQHDDASSTLAPSSLPLSQGMASFVHFIPVTSSGAVNGHVLGLADVALTCPREATVAALWDQLKKHQVVHVRGTPTSGKSTLAQLLKDYVGRTSPNTQVYAFSWQRPEVLEKKGVSWSCYYQLLNSQTGRPIDTDDWLRMRNMLLIMDAAQTSYQYADLWTQFIKRVSSDGDETRRVVLFSSYGSPAETPLIHGPPGSSPIQLTADQRASIRPLSNNNQKFSLYFTRPEFDDVVARVCRDSGKNGQPFCPSSELLDHVWDFSNGHPAGTRVVLDALINSEVSVCSFYYPLYF
jgi:hypothetical protein